MPLTSREGQANGAPMNAVILSAGRGSRLLPLTDEIPKCLVKVGPRAILDHQLHALAAAGAARAFVVGGYRHDRIAAHLRQTPPPLPVELRFNPFWAVSSSIGSVWAVRNLLAGPFCLMNGDTVLAPPVLRRALAAAPAGIGLLAEPIERPETDDMLIQAEGAQVRAVAKSLDPALATHRSLGVIVAGAESGYRDALDGVIGRPRGIEAYHHDVVAELARRQTVELIVEESGAWAEIDRPEDIDGWCTRRQPD